MALGFDLTGAIVAVVVVVVVVELFFEVSTFLLDPVTSSKCIKNIQINISSTSISKFSEILNFLLVTVNELT